MHEYDRSGASCVRETACDAMQFRAIWRSVSAGIIAAAQGIIKASGFLLI